jgi:SAM-dependent methyltransferase
MSTGPASPEPRPPLPTSVAVPRAGDDALLAVAVLDGVAELGAAVLLRGAARRLFERHGPALDAETTARELVQEGADPEEARADATRFLEELRASGLVRADADRAGGSGPDEPPAPAARDEEVDAAPPAPLAADDLEALARAVLARDVLLRFRASGRSMRATIPDGSTLEVEARAAGDVRLGEVILYTTGERRLVAHRVVGRRDGALLARGETCARLDVVPPADLLGVVRARIGADGRALSVSSGPRRLAGLAAGLVWRPAAALLRTLVIRPLRASLDRRSLVRRSLWRGLRAASGLLLANERIAQRLRRPLDVASAALLTEREKDEDRGRLYERRSVQAFTSLDENLEAGLTLLEEAIFARHELPRGRALVLGCGPGRECLALARMGFEVTGVDREEGMLARARALAREAGLPIDYVAGEAVEVDLDRPPHDLVVVFSGLYNMVLPSARRIRMLAAARAALVPGGRVLVTFLSDYVPRDAPPTPTGGFWSAVNPAHEAGDLYFLNEAIRVFPRGTDVEDEARAAGLETEVLARDQRAYDRRERRVLGYAILRRPAA